ncbi:MAG: GNAT family N-acetyltransferase [Solirubrobacterales bacterium]
MAERVAVAPRRAEQAELPELARMLARAFHEDPVAAWACRPESLRPRVLERLFGMRLRDLHPRGEIWTDDDLRSVAVWAAPEQWHTTARQDIAYATTLLHPRLMLRMPTVVTGMLGAQKVHPGEPPHWYLAILGTDLSAQGRGLGSSLLAPVLKGCDHDGVGAYLESSKEQNLDFYARHGFRVTSERRLPRGPTLWPMWRDPR